MTNEWHTLCFLKPAVCLLNHPLGGKYNKVIHVCSFIPHSEIPIYDQIHYGLLEEDGYLTCSRPCLQDASSFSSPDLIVFPLCAFPQADVRPQTDGCNGLRYNLTSDIIESIFRTYPAGKSSVLHTKHIHLRLVFIVSYCRKTKMLV